MLCSAFSLENLWSLQNWPLWLLTAPLHWTQTKDLWKPKLLDEWCRGWCWCEDIFFEGYLEIQYFFPSPMERRRCITLLRHESNWFSVKKVSTGLKYCALLLSNATSSNKEAPLYCATSTCKICHTLTTVLKGVRRGVGVKNSLELDILRKLYFLRKGN